MRYYINFDKTINQLVPHFFGGRKLILYLQALMKPLRMVNDTFVDYAKETRIEAAMTSQKFMFEWYLNRKFKKYFADSSLIVISGSTTLGTPLYHESANLISTEEHATTYRESENVGDKNLLLYRSDDKTDESSVSFVVTSPAIKTEMIDSNETEAIKKYKAMLAYYIDEYRLAGKTYIIKINS